MERVDVMVIGASIEGLAAAAAAAAGGVRTILLERDAFIARSPTVLGLRVHQAAEMRLQDPDRTLSRWQCGEREPVELAGDLLVLAHRSERVRDQLLDRAQRAGSESRERLGELSVSRADPDGWHVRPSEGEAVRGRVLIVADGPRSRVPARLNVERIPRDAADVVTYLCATWALDAERAQAQNIIRSAEGKGAYSQTLVIPGRASVSAAVGPIWRGVAAPGHDWAHEDDPLVPTLLERAQRLTGIGVQPDFIELVEHRIAPLARSAIADACLVAGSALGIAAREPLLDAHQRWLSGTHAGQAAAKAILGGDLSARAMERALPEAARELKSATEAALSLEAHGMRVRREYGDDAAWRSVRA